MGIVLDADVQRVVEFMEAGFPGLHAGGNSHSVHCFAPILWGHYLREVIASPRLDRPTIRVVNNQTPTDLALALIVLMMVLRWKRLIKVRSDLASTAHAAIDS